MPKLWNDTIETHRRAVRDATLDVTAALVAERGLRGVTMSEIAEKTGIGRATLYKYFPDVEAILLAWHEREIAGHLEELEKIRDQATGAVDQVRAVLEGYAHLSRHGHHDAEMIGVLHRDPSAARGRQQVRSMIRDLLIEGAKTGELRDDVAPDELARYCFHAVGAANGLSSKAAVQRLVSVILAGLRPAA
jgi:AcrR family transcriptional regulator